MIMQFYWQRQTCPTWYQNRYAAIICDLKSHAKLKQAFIILPLKYIQRPSTVLDLAIRALLEGGLFKVYWSVSRPAKISIGCIREAYRTFACKSQECLWQDWYISDFSLPDSVLTGPKTCFNMTWFIYISPSHFIIPMNHNKNPVDWNRGNNVIPENEST